MNGWITAFLATGSGEKNPQAYRNGFMKPGIDARYIPMMIQKITPLVEKNCWLKSLNLINQSKFNKSFQSY